MVDYFRGDVMSKIKNIMSDLYEKLRLSLVYDAFIAAKNYTVKHKFVVPAVVTAIFVVGFAISPLISKFSSNISTDADIESEYTAFTQKIFVTVTGEVKNPDIYEMTTDDRIADAIEKAGGFTENAYKENLNLAQKLTDEQYIKVISVEETEKLDSSKLYPDELSIIVNINEATIEELCKLPGIGESTAESIIEYRESKGGFKNIEELKQIKGIGSSKYDKIKNNITV